MAMLKIYYTMGAMLLLLIYEFRWIFLGVLIGVAAICGIISFGASLFDKIEIKKT